MEMERRGWICERPHGGRVYRTWQLGYRNVKEIKDCSKAESLGDWEDGYPLNEYQELG